MRETSHTGDSPCLHTSRGGLPAGMDSFMWGVTDSRGAECSKSLQVGKEIRPVADSSRSRGFFSRYLRRLGRWRVRRGCGNGE